VTRSFGTQATLSYQIAWFYHAFTGKYKVSFNVFLYYVWLLKTNLDMILNQSQFDSRAFRENLPSDGSRLEPVIDPQLSLTLLALSTMLHFLYESGCSLLPKENDEEANNPCCITAPIYSSISAFTNTGGQILCFQAPPVCRWLFCE